MHVALVAKKRPTVKRGEMVFWLLKWRTGV